MRPFRLVSVTAAAAATCALWALPASAAIASPQVRHATTTTVTATPRTAYVHAAVKLSATVRSRVGTPTGTVTFTWNGAKLCTATLHRGSGSCVTRFSRARTYSVRGTYGGDARHTRSSGNTSVTAKLSPTTTKITNTNPGIITVGKSYTFHVTVVSATGAPAATGKVKLTPRPRTNLAGYTCTARLTAGKGSCTIKPAEYGIENYTATYTGDAGHTASASDGKFALQVQNVTTTKVTAPSPTVGNVTLDGLVYAKGANITVAKGGTGTVAFYLSTMSGSKGKVISGCAKVQLTTFTNAPDFDNIATCSNSATLNKLPAGTYYITAVYTGDLTNVGSRSKRFTLHLS